NAVLGVVLPDTCGPGGDLFALVHSPGDTIPSVLNASGRAGSGVTSDDMRDSGLGAIPMRSKWSITVPGCVDGWEALVARYGSLPLSRLLEPAIEIARDGFPVSSELASSLTRTRDLIADQPSSKPFYRDGQAARTGTTMRRPGFGDTLEAIADDGRSAFYGGSVGAAITEATDGAITEEDLERPQADWVTPLTTTVFNRSAWTVPPNSQGYLTLATLKIFEMLDPPDDPNDPLYQHLLIESYRSVAWEREDIAVDPDRTLVSDEDLLADDRLAERVATINPSRAGRWPMPRRSPGGTAYMTVRDAKGMGISLIQSNFWGIGSGRSARATGVFLHNRGAGFNLIPGHQNEFAPQKRPLHTLSPTLWTNGSSLDLLLGTRGGDQQPQYLAQFAASFYQAHNCTDDSQALPRWSMSQPLPGTDSVIEYESRTAPSTIEGLRERGHVVEVVGPYGQGWGPVSAIDTGREMKGSADPRITTSAALTTTRIGR
ncbi:MAG: gamma-glutamyltransferase family protein, partial [Actinomycetia bacterium]|nr:gamma-glutamyltransferase family protein [Actinomycetes bacterium]